MLTVADFDTIETPMTNLYERLAISILRDMARRLAGVEMTSGAAWQMQRLIESGSMFEDILFELEGYTLIREETLRKAFLDAGVKSIKFDNKIFDKAGARSLTKRFADNLSPPMMDVLKAGLQKTAGTLQNLTLTTASQGQNLFVEALDLMYMQLTSGTMSYDQSLRGAIKDLVAKGVRAVSYDSGHVDHVDVAARRALLTGVSQTTAEIQIMNLANFGTDLVQVSAHYGARNRGDLPENHEMWQGRVYSISGMTPGYPDFIEWTGYGSGEGLCGWNCRHSFFPFFEGMSVNPYTEKELEMMAKKTVTYNGREYSQYEASQIQRSYERKVRFYKREAEALAAAKCDNTEELKKARAWQKKIREFCDETELVRQPAREGGRVPVFRAPPKKAPEKLPPPPKPPKPKPKYILKPVEPKIEPGEAFNPLTYKQPQLPGMPPQPEPDFYDEMKKFQDRVVTQDFETIGLFDGKTGALIGYTDGDADQVAMVPDLARQVKGNMTVHNHPKDVPFSDADIELAFLRMEKEARAVTATRVFRWIGTDEWEKFVENLDFFDSSDRMKARAVFNDYWRETIRKLEDENGIDFWDTLYGYINTDEWDLYDLFVDKLWRKFAELCPYFIYRVERR